MFFMFTVKDLSLPSPLITNTGCVTNSTIWLTNAVFHLKTCSVRFTLSILSKKKKILKKFQKKSLNINTQQRRPDVRCLVSRGRQRVEVPEKQQFHHMCWLLCPDFLRCLSSRSCRRRTIRPPETAEAILGESDVSPVVCFHACVQRLKYEWVRLHLCTFVCVYF